MPIAGEPERVVAAVRELVEREVKPAAAALEHADEYPHALVARLRELGLFGALIPADYGGLGLDVRTYARVIEELCRGWMSLAGVINSHTMAALIVLDHGTPEQRARFLPRFARGEARGGLCLTEPHAGSDVQAIRTVARRRGDAYVVAGTKMFVTNGREGNTFALLALTDPAAQPRHRGMSCFIVEKGPGFTVVKSISKLGYKGVDTAELLFEDFVVPGINLVGGLEGRGFAHVMSGLETGRINIAARAVGVAQAAYEEALAHARQERRAPSRLADMAAPLAAARLLTGWAGGMKDRGERCDLEAGMAKLFASETAQQVAAQALGIVGAGALATTTVERHYRDTPLMIIGEGTNEIQRTIIARTLLTRYGERTGPLVALDADTEERRQIVLAVRQLVEKIVPIAQESDAATTDEGVARLAEMGILGAVVPAEQGGLALDHVTLALVIEELARSSATLAAIVTAHLGATAAVAVAGSAAQRERWLPGLARGDSLATVALVALPLGNGVEGGGGRRLSGEAGLVANARRAHLIVFGVDAPDRIAIVERGAPGLVVEAPPPALGTRGLDRCPVRLRDVAVPEHAILGGAARAPTGLAAAGAVLRLGSAASAVGIAQAAFEAALRYSQQRSTFGKPICQHQAVQLKLADMATRVTAARLLTADAGHHCDDGDGALAVGLARLFATEVACDVTLDAMRIHGGYGYTTEFTVERYYRDAAQLALGFGGNDAEREALARRLAAETAAARP